MDYSTIAERELISLIRGDCIGTGTYRNVFKYLPDTSIVIKIEKDGYKFDNVTEWEMWRELEGTPYRNWLASCLTISPSGVVLMQERTERVPAAMLPKLVPSIFRDTKADNWGLVVRDGKKLIVCHDYAHSRLLNVPKKVKLVPASWHNPDYKGWST